MAATWSIGGVSIYIDEDSGSEQAVIGEQHVLDATVSTKHHSGSMGEKRTVAGTLFDTDGSQLSTLRSYTNSSTVRALVTDLGAAGNWHVANVQWERKQALNYAYGVYRVNIELVEPSS